MPILAACKIQWHFIFTFCTGRMNYAISASITLIVSHVLALGGIATACQLHAGVQ